MARQKGGGRGPWVVAAIVAAGILLLWVFSSGRQSLRKVTEPTAPPRASGDNLLANAGFEDGESGWSWLSWSKGWAPFEISSGRRRSGEKAVHMPVRSQGETRRTIVWGAVQEVRLGASFPECLEGWYLVAGWARGAEKQYLQTVIISDLKTDSGADKQIRMMLTGMDVPSYNLTNARYFFCDPDRPVTPPLEKWVRFRCSPRKWFEEAWGVLPKTGDRLRVFFEARFDDRAPSATEVVADAYFDDLYLGPATPGHCD